MDFVAEDFPYSGLHTSLDIEFTAVLYHGSKCYQKQYRDSAGLITGSIYSFYIQFPEAVSKSGWNGDAGVSGDVKQSDDCGAFYSIRDLYFLYDGIWRDGV